MKNILLFGSAPLPDVKNGICSAAGLRTQQFLGPLKKEHRVRLFLVGGDNTEGAWTTETSFEISRQSPQLISVAQKILRENNCDAVIGVNTFPAYIAAKALKNKIPFWADLNGWIMAEMQAQSYELGHNHYLQRGWEQEKTILLRADVISTVSTAQRFATIGELATLGRLNKEHFSEDFVRVIPNAPDFFQKNALSNSNIFEERAIPKDAFVIAQIGGFNNWVDEETLFRALEIAMEDDPSIHFVSTGGEIADIATSPFSRFQEKVEGSVYRDRFHLLGWIDADDIPEIYSSSHIGIMADKMCIETETGARNRLNEMMQFGLPIVATEGSEISRDIRDWNCGLIIESGNVDALKNALLQLKNEELLREKLAQKAQEICHHVLIPKNTLQPVLNWLQQEKPQLLHTHRTPVEGPSEKIRAGAQFLKERGWKSFFQKLWQRIQGK